MLNALSDKKAITVFMFPAVLLFLLVLIAPLGMSLYYSMLKWDGIGKGTFILFGNFRELFFNNRDTFPASVIHSFIFVLLSVFIQLPVALFFAILLTGAGIKRESFFRTVFFIPVIISTVVIGQLWLKVYHPDYGLLNTVLRAIGLGSLAHAWIGELDTVLMSAFVPILWQYVGYHMLLMYAAIKSIPTEIYEAAIIDGAGPQKMAFRITIPLIRPMLKVCVTFSVIGSVKVFDLIYVLTNGGPARASEVPSTLMVKTIFLSFRYGYGSAMAVFIILECFIFSYLVDRIFRAVGTEV